jgi:hypothetical protein
MGFTFSLSDALLGKLLLRIIAPVEMREPHAA